MVKTLFEKDPYQGYPDIFCTYNFSNAVLINEDGLKHAVLCEYVRFLQMDA